MCIRDSSRYSRRSRSEYEKIADYIEKIVQERTGNYMVFFPSYQYLDSVQAVLEERERKKPHPFIWFSQQSHMTEEEREEFLSRFEAGRQQSMAALCVMGEMCIRDRA